MSARPSRVVSFLAGAGMIGVAAVLNRACPGQCASCSTCATALVPMGTAVGAVGVAFAGSALARARGARGISASPGEDDASDG